MIRAARRGRVLAALLALGLLAGCSTAISGTGSIGLNVRGASGSRFDAQAERALSAIISYWTVTYPRIANGAPLPHLRGRLYSVDGAQVVRTGRAPRSAADEKCLQLRLAFIVDNAAYCKLDDSIIWDRAPRHMLPVLADAYGPALTALVFAHEFGHAVQRRLHVVSSASRLIDLESQADCAAGAFAAAAVAGRTAPVSLTAADLDRALVGYLQIRDTTPESPQDISHGDGFDRLDALQLGIRSGAPYCFSPSYLRNRSYTERGYVRDDDYLQGGNQPLADVVDPDQLGGDLNRFWTSAAGALGKSFTAVHLTEADHPDCGPLSSSTRFGYCPDDNTVYYSAAFAHRAYYSITVPDIDRHDGDVTLRDGQPGDFALGMLIAMGWGMAVEHQFAARGTGDRRALLDAICFAGSYAEDVNRPDYDATHRFVLSPPDMDEATSAVLTLVGPDAFGTRGTTALQRIRAFVTGYHGGVRGC